MNNQKQIISCYSPVTNFERVLLMSADFREHNLTNSLKDFAKIIGEQLKKLRIELNFGNGQTEIVLDDKEIDSKSDIKTSNGRYYFRKNEIWRRCYIPYADSPGVYFFFDGGGSAMYIGKAERTIGTRVFSHIGKEQNGGFSDIEFPEADYVIVIPFEIAPFLSPAYESFLLSKYKFKYNKIGQ